ncbi:MAG TPA: coenzyme F420-0:L-glutamate ligase, partial [Nitrososphaera sp.]|nr:coenzyme F420-0:L-glutamate ligase [Nitrososphaera sp.]
GIIITETLHGFVCANSGIDQSNVEGDSAVLLPENPDASARALRAFIKEAEGVTVAVIITDTFGRAFRMGQTNVAIGVAGLEPIKSYIGSKDMFGRRLKVTEIAVADEIASASELVMGKAEGIPIAIVRGYTYAAKERASGRSLLRPENEDLFR